MILPADVDLAEHLPLDQDDDDMARMQHIDFESGPMKPDLQDSRLFGFVRHGAFPIVEKILGLIGS